MDFSTGINVNIKSIYPLIISNKIRCKNCGDVIESKTVHDYVTCSCGRCSVDGGMEYLRRAYTDRRTDFEELSEYDVRLIMQDFLKAKTDEGLSFAKIKELLAGAPYHITVTEKDSLALFKYSQLESDWNEPICRECRGLILEKGTWKVVRYAFDKFFNINESYAAEIDWASATSTEKIDGSLISLFYYKDKWCVATNGMIDAYDVALSPNEKYKTYGELWEAAMNSNYPRFLKDGIEKLNPNCTYTFELVSPYNKVVIYYDNPMVYHIGTRYNLNFEEMDIDIGIQKPKSYKLEGQDEYIRFVLEKWILLTRALLCVTGTLTALSSKPSTTLNWRTG